MSEWSSMARARESEQESNERERESRYEVKYHSFGQIYHCIFIRIENPHKATLFSCRKLVPFGNKADKMPVAHAIVATKLVMSKAELTKGSIACTDTNAMSSRPKP